MRNRQQDQGLYETRREHDACGIGAVVNIEGKKSHAIIEYGRQVLVNLHHRGAAGSDEITGDGAGILMQIPHKFFAKITRNSQIKLPAEGTYAVGMIFCPKNEELKNKCNEILNNTIKKNGLTVAGYRNVPVNRDCLGKLALEAEPTIEQIFVNANEYKDEVLERKLFLARKQCEKQINEKFGNEANEYYICSLSAKTICYKGMFMAWQLFTYYTDLKDETTQSALAIVHQRYSTNTFPNWKLAQPFRCIAHNGEINTLSGNKNAMLARENNMTSDAFGENIKDIFPVITENASDSACFDNALELLVRAGRTMPHSMMMMIPEAFGTKYHISTDKRAFYEYHTSLMEPWDGPAAMVFTDGRLLGGTLDRNGLRPCRYVITNDSIAIIASEAGVVEFPPEKIQKNGRLQPGHMFLVDTKEGRIVTDNEIKSKISRQKPYRRWLEENRIELRGLFDSPKLVQSDPETIFQQMRAFGYDREELKMILIPMAVNGQEPIGSMGNDTPLAVLSDKPKKLFDYFKQLFAQVTNPPIDPLREGLVMSLMAYTGKKRNLLNETPKHCRQLKLPHPILTNEDIDRLKTVKHKDFKAKTITALFEANTENPESALENALEKLAADAVDAVENGASMLIVSDQNVSENMAAIPSLLATAAVHNALLEKGLRAETGIIVESGEPREVMHFCLLCGYGANAVNPYMVFESLNELHRQKELPGNLEPEKIADNYIAAVKKGILKTMSKMGISTLRSYNGAQLFEAIGLNSKITKKYFTHTSSRIEGIGLKQIAKDTLTKHKNAYNTRKSTELELDFAGEYHFRHTGEQHLWNPVTIAKLQHAVKYQDQKAYDEYAKAVNELTQNHCTLRGLFELTESNEIPLEKIEPATEIVKRFCTGAMSHGSISKEAHECMAIAMNRINAMSNTGEGGEDPKRYETQPNGDSKNSAIKQVASGRFGVTINYLAHAKEIQIKMAQGAKPGEGGQLPGHKVTEEIAKMRFSTPGVTLISPPPHHDIYSIEDLAQLIYDLKCSNPGVKVSVKLVSEVGVGTIAAGVAKGNADEVLISGHDGGTGASPLSSIKYVGCPWELGLAETQQVLVNNNLRNRIRLQVDGQLKTGRDIVIGALLGAEQFGFGTTALVAMGCTLLRKCHEGTCAFGIATQDTELRKRFAGKPEYITRYMMFVAEEVRKIMAKLGFKKFDDMVGQVNKLNTRKAIDHYKAKGLDFSAIFYAQDFSDGREIRKTTEQADKLKDHLDWKILEKCRDAIENKTNAAVTLPIRNTDRTVGTIVSNAIAKKYGQAALPDGTINITLNGSAGQSLGAFLAKGVTIKLTGQSNDYLGKGLSGGRIIVKTPEKAGFAAHDNIIVGNTLLYGATSGEVFINGMAGERFAVRNSGAVAVVEGLGDHGCEYMTGGTVVVLGKTGCNFAAGMSGGIAYVLDEMQLFDTLCNLDLVELESIWKKEDKQQLKNLIEQHCKWTNSKQAERILESWQDVVGKFVKVVPIDYRKALAKMMEAERRQTETTPATEEVF